MCASRHTAFVASQWKQECVKPLIQAADGTNKSAQLQDISEAKALPVAEVPQVQKPNLIKSKQSSTDPKAGAKCRGVHEAIPGCAPDGGLHLPRGAHELGRLHEGHLEDLCRKCMTNDEIDPLSRPEDPLLTMRKAAEGLRRLGVEYVLDTSAAESVALLEGKAEFIQRYKAAFAASGARSASAPEPPVASYGGSSSSSKGRLPLLTSHCPGWTVYAEKVVDPVILPQLCQLRPPQHVQGRLVKTCLLEAHNRRQLHRWWRARSPLFAMEGKALLCQAQTTKALSDPPTPVTAEEVYHVFVQPCYDRKIEAARPHFEVSGDPESTLVGASRLAPGRVVGRPGLFGRVVQVVHFGDDGDLPPFDDSDDCLTSGEFQPVASRATSEFTTTTTTTRSSKKKLTSALLKQHVRELGFSFPGLDLCPLHIAAYVGDHRAVRFLLLNGSKLRQKSPRGLTALEMAKAANRGGSHDKVIALLKAHNSKDELMEQMAEEPDASGIKEVDTVLTATELLDLLREAGEGCCGGCGKSACEKTELQKLPPVSIQSEWARSGGFLEHIFREAAQELFAMEVSSSPLVLQTKQNEDLREVCLKDPKSQEVLLRFTAAYGFRNIQNVIRRVAKLNGTNGSFKDVGHFVEIMACPGGCLNGGGQIPDAKSEERSLSGGVCGPEAKAQWLGGRAP
eukprot:g30041.t1